MAIIDKKQKRWYSKSTFDSLDKTAIPVGTEIQVTGAIGETDLDSALQSKINGKLTAPTTPTADSAITMLADGTVGTKPLSEIGGGKLFRHKIGLIRNGIQVIDFYFYRSTDAHIPLNEMRTYFINIQALYFDENSNYYTGYAYFYDTSVSFKGTIIEATFETASWKLANLSKIPFTEFEVNYSVTEL